MRKFLLIISAFLLSVFIMSGCEESSTGPATNTGPANERLEVVSPNGGESYKVGQTVAITFKINADKVSGAMLKVSIDDGKSWTAIVSKQVSPLSGGGNQTLKYDWVIGQEKNSVSYLDSNIKCKLKISDYTDGTVFDVSNTVFTILK